MSGSWVIKCKYFSLLSFHLYLVLKKMCDNKLKVLGQTATWQKKLMVCLRWHRWCSADTDGLATCILWHFHGAFFCALVILGTDPSFKERLFYELDLSFSMKNSLPTHPSIVFNKNCARFLSVILIRLTGIFSSFFWQGCTSFDEFLKQAKSFQL